MKYHKLILRTFLLSILGVPMLTAQVGLDPQIGQNYMYWIYGQGFFSGYYQSSATLNTIGDNCYVFTEDALVRDLKVAPWDSRTLVATTNSGVFVSTDAGSTWVSSNGSGSDILPEEPAYNLANEPVVSLDNFPIQHRKQVNSIGFQDEETWWVGTKGAKGVYRSTDSDSTWKRKNTGLPTLDPDGPTEPKPSENPNVYKVFFVPGQTKVYAATNAGLFYRKTSRFLNIGNGFPDPPTVDWPSIPVYDILAYDTLLVAATEQGLFRGSVEEEFEDKLPIEGGTVTIDTTFLTYVVEERLDSSKTEYFTIDWETGDSIWVYEYTTSYDTVSWYLTLGLADTSSARKNLAIDQWVNIMDDSTGTHWNTKVAYNSNLGFFTDLMNERVYHFNSEFFDDDDPDSTTYKDYNTSHLNVYLTGGETVFDIAVDSTGVIYYGTASGVYSASIDGGTPTDLGLTDVTVNDLALSTDEGFLFVATTEGLMRTSLAGNIEWSEATPKIYTLNTGDSLSYMTTCIAIANEDTIYVGCGTPLLEDPRIVTYRTGGILASYDGGETWTPINIGLTNRSINPEDVASIQAAFDSTTVADSSKGLYEMLTNWYGDVPNVDGDDRVIILIADMDDNAYNSTSDLVIQGYFNSADQSLTDIQPYSNMLDIIYIDSDPLDPGEGQEGISRAISRLICYNYDPDEVEWVLTGLEHFASFITGHKSMPEDSIFTIQNDNSLMVGDYARIREYNQLFSIMEYLYEHYFSEDPFSLESDATKLMYAIVQETGTGTDGLDSVLTAVTGGLKDFSDVFVEWALAVHFDNPDSSLNDGLYGFSNIDVEVAPSTYPWGVTSGVAPYSESINNWSAKFMQTEKWVDKGEDGWVNKAPNFNGKTLVFNGSDASDIALFIIKQKNKLTKDSTASIDYIELDTVQNRAVYTDWSDFGTASVVTDSSIIVSIDTVNAIIDTTYINPSDYQYFAIIAVCRGAGVETGGSFVVDDELDSPGLFDLQVDQNCELTNYLDIYAFSDMRVYADGAVGNDEDLEGPNLKISDGDSVLISFVIPRFYDAGDGYIYRSPFDLREFLPSTTYEFLFIGSAESIGGNKIDSDTVIVMAIEVPAATGRFISSKLGGFTLSIPSFAFDEDAFITIIEKPTMDSPGSVIPLKNVFTIGTKNHTLKKSIKVEFDLTGIDLSSFDVEKLDIVVLQYNTINSLEAIVNMDKMVVTADVPVIGSIQLVMNPAKKGVNALPTEYALHQNYPNPFNPATTLKYDLPEDAQMTLKVFDILGREVITLANEFKKAGHYSVKWTGQDNHGNSVATGIYFCQFNTENYSKTLKMVLVK